MEFAKGHGTGNDFVILPDPDGALNLSPSIVATLCDRRFGIGGDGLLRVVRAAKHPDGQRYADQAEWFMDYWNADGSLAEMCGNGARVFARYLTWSGLVDAAAPALQAEPIAEATATGFGDSVELPLATRSGVRLVRFGGSPEADISIEMGPPALGLSSSALVDGVRWEGVSVDVGNPHLVCPVPDVDALAGLDLTRAPILDPAVFPAGANVEFVVAMAPDRVQLRVHERGAGETLSCGTGAVAAAAWLSHRVGAEPITVDVPGGRLVVTIRAGESWLTGPAVITATGTALV